MFLLSEEKVREIDRAGRRILNQVGLRILDSAVLKRLETAGCPVDFEDQRVRFHEDWLDRTLGLAPPQFVLHSRDGQNDLALCAGNVYFGNGGRVFRVLDMGTGGYRSTYLRDVTQTAGLVNVLGNIRFYVIACQAHDLEPSYYHLNDFFQAFNNTSKHVMGGCDNLEGVKQVWELASFIAGGEDHLREKPFVSVITNPVSPLTIDATTLQVLEFCAVKGIPVTVAPAPIAGATAPASLAGTLVQMHAEALAGVVLAQVFAPGARVMYGAVPTAMDLRTMDLTMGSTETVMMNTTAVKLAKLYHLPIYASAGLTEAKIPDVQAGFEKGVSNLLVGMAGADYIHLAAGILDSGNSMSYEQFIIDNEILGMVHRILKGIEVNDETLAVQCIQKVGPGGNFVMEDHTAEQMFREYFYPGLAIRMNFDRWEEENKPTPLTRANKSLQVFKEMQNTVLDPELTREIRHRFPEIVDLS